MGGIIVIVGLMWGWRERVGAGWVLGVFTFFIFLN